jgi:hypothetical protein
MGDSALKIDKLGGSSNWELWQLRMQSLMAEKGYWAVTGEDYMDIDQESVKQKQEEIKLRAIAYIRLHLKDGPLLQTRYISDPRELWKKL